MTSIADVFWFSVGAFAAFEIALGLNYLLLKFVLEAMRTGARPQPLTERPAAGLRPRV